MNKYTATQLVELLATRHNGDVFVSECKNGPSHVGGLQRLDGWAMKRSWAHPLVTGYEVKVSRSDFLGDDKWRGYLPYCNEFYFVAPPKVIDLAELPADAGLLVCSVNACRLFRRKKAPYRDVQIPESIYRYVMFSRAAIGGTYWNPEEGSSRDFWAAWLAAKTKDLDIGHRVGKELRKAITKRIDEVGVENHRLTKQMERYDDLRKTLKELGIEDGRYVSGYSIRERVEKLRALVPASFVNTIDRAHDALEQLQEKVAELTDPETETEATP